MFNIKSIKSIEVVATRWTDGMGNTYFSGVISVNTESGTKKFDMPFQYGYGNYYRHIAWEMLKDKISGHDGYNHCYIDAFCDKHDIHYSGDMETVKRKKDMM